MGILDFLAGSSPEKHAQKADEFVIIKAYGNAKIEYEKALAKLDRLKTVKPGTRRLIEDKLRRCKESLAREHRKEGQALIAAGCSDEARELLDLALELTDDARLAADVNHLLETIPVSRKQPEGYDFVVPESQAENGPEEDPAGSDEEYFEALCNSLEEAESEAYRHYPETFKKGFIALNRGDFDTAVTLLAEAAGAYPFGANYITLELATAHLNRGEHDTARTLLESFLQEYPDSLKAYSLMCEILWETGAFDEAQRLLAGCPSTLAALLPVKLLVGETFVRSNQVTQAVDLYQDLLATHGWDPLVAQALAGAYEAQGQNEPARDLYGEIIGTCTGCGTRVDPVIKHRYAETSFAAGDFSTEILELYLELVQADPANRLGYYHRISHIYSLQGNDYESRRFAAFAEQIVPEEK